MEERLRVLIASLIRRGRLEAREVEEGVGLPLQLAVELTRGLPVRLEGDSLVASDAVELILACWRRGFDPVELALRAGWREFERLCARVFEEHGFRALTNVRFSSGGALRELDVVALREPRILAVDCKLWRRARESALRRTVRAHKERCAAFAQAAPAIPRVAAEVARWRSARVVPAIVDLHEVSLKVFEGVPIVPLRKLSSFIEELEAYEGDLLAIPVEGRSEALGGPGA